MGLHADHLFLFIYKFYYLLHVLIIDKIMLRGHDFDIVRSQDRKKNRVASIIR